MTALLEKEEIVLKTYLPTPTQEKYHRSPQRHKLFGGAVGGGKTLTLCEEVVRLMLMYPGNRAYMCRRLLADFMMSTYMTLIEKTIVGQLISLRKAHHDRSKRIITFHNGSKIFYGGLDDQEETGGAGKSLRRIKSTEFGVIAIDEASEVTESDFRWADSRLRHKLPNDTFPPYYILLASNPSQNWIKNRFIDSPDPKQDIFIQSLTRDNPHLPPGYEDQLKSTFRSKEWEQVYLEGSWDALRDIDQLIPYSALQKCIKCVPTRAGGRGRVIACDPALQGDDECVIQDWRFNELQDQKIFPYIEQSMYIVGELRDWFDSKQAQRIAVDAVGIGDGVCSRLDETIGSQFTMRIVAGESQKEDSTRPEDKQPLFFNFKAQMWWYMRNMVLDRAVSFPDNEDSKVLIGQLASMKYHIRSDKKITIESKEQYKKRIGKSPDRADCAVIGLWALRDCPEPDFQSYHDDYEHSFREKRVSNYGMGARVRK